MALTTITTSKPFSFRQTLAFINGFPPCRGDYLIGDFSITAAISVRGRAVPFTISATADDDLLVDTPEPSLALRAAEFVGARDDVGAFYSAAMTDAALAPVVRMLFGLHHVRFLTFEEIAVYSVMMQRNPINRAGAMKRRFLERFGLPLTVGSRTLRAMPELGALSELSGDEIGDAIGHRGKGETIAGVVRRLSRIGEEYLRSAPYSDARAALLGIPGIGPFSAGAILLRGLGRMDEVPSMQLFEREARAFYGDRYDEAAILRRYGRSIGYWSYYVKAATGRLARSAAA